MGVKDQRVRSSLARPQNRPSIKSGNAAGLRPLAVLPAYEVVIGRAVFRFLLQPVRDLFTHAVSIDMNHTDEAGIAHGPAKVIQFYGKCESVPIF